METLNLSNNTFSDTEIEALFNLKNPYTSTDVLSAKYLLTQLVYDNYNLDNEKQKEILFFIDRFSERIQQKVSSSSSSNNDAAAATAATMTQHVTQHGSNFLIEN